MEAAAVRRLGTRLAYVLRAERVWRKRMDDVGAQKAIEAVQHGVAELLRGSHRMASGTAKHD
eukprot:12131903-Prorocentrum_lima.AAC.1